MGKRGERAEPTWLHAVHREFFVDERGGMRVSWHPEREVTVFSLWKGGECVGTFHLSMTDAGRLAGMLSTHLGEWVAEREATANADPGPRARGKGRRTKLLGGYRSSAEG